MVYFKTARQSVLSGFKCSHQYIFYCLPRNDTLWDARRTKYNWSRVSQILRCCLWQEVLSKEASRKTFFMCTGRKYNMFVFLKFSMTWISLCYSQCQIYLFIWERYRYCIKAFLHWNVTKKMYNRSNKTTKKQTKYSLDTLLIYIINYATKNILWWKHISGCWKNIVISLNSM